MKDGLGSIRTDIQGQGAGAVAAAGERALAETAALLVLSKKVQAIFNKGEDE